MRKLIHIFAVAMFFVVGVAYAEPVTLSKKQISQVQSELEKIALKNGLSKDWVDSSVRSVVASMLGNDDDAKVWDSFAEFFLVASRAEQCHEVAQEVSRGTPGTEVPMELVRQINMCGLLLGVVSQRGMNAFVTAATYVTNQALKTEACKKGNMNFSKCLDALKSAMDLAEKGSTIMKLSVDLAGSLRLAVASRMTY